MTPSLYFVLVPLLLCESVPVHVMCRYEISHCRQKGTPLVCSEWSHDCTAQAQIGAQNNKEDNKATNMNTASLTSLGWAQQTQSESRWKKKKNPMFIGPGNDEPWGYLLWLVWAVMKLFVIIVNWWVFSLLSRASGSARLILHMAGGRSQSSMNVRIRHPSTIDKNRFYIFSE